MTTLDGPWPSLSFVLRKWGPRILVKRPETCNQGCIIERFLIYLSLRMPRPAARGVQNQNLTWRMPNKNPRPRSSGIPSLGQKMPTNFRKILKCQSWACFWYSCGILSAGVQFKEKFRVAPVRFGSVMVWGWKGSIGSGFRFRRFLYKKGFSLFLYIFKGKDGSGSGFGSWKTVPAVPVPLSLSGKTVLAIPVSGSGSVPEPPWKLLVGAGWCVVSFSWPVTGRKPPTL